MTTLKLRELGHLRRNCLFTAEPRLPGCPSSILFMSCVVFLSSKLPPNSRLLMNSLTFNMIYFNALKFLTLIIWTSQVKRFFSPKYNLFARVSEPLCLLFSLSELSSDSPNLIPLSPHSVKPSAL